MQEVDLLQRSSSKVDGLRPPKKTPVSANQTVSSHLMKAFVHAAACIALDIRAGLHNSIICY